MSSIYYYFLKTIMIIILENRKYQIEILIFYSCDTKFYPIFNKISPFVLKGKFRFKKCHGNFCYKSKMKDTKKGIIKMYLATKFCSFYLKPQEINIIWLNKTRVVVVWKEMRFDWVGNLDNRVWGRGVGGFQFPPWVDGHLSVTKRTKNGSMMLMAFTTKEGPVLVDADIWLVTGLACEGSILGSVHVGYSWDTFGCVS